MQKGRKWIFLRGLVRWKVHWGDFFEEFKKAFPQDEILLLDLPGFGDYYQKPSPTSMEGLIEHLEGLVDWSQGPYHVLAFSLGGMVAAKWAEKRKNHFVKMFLVNTSDRRSPSFQRFRWKNFWLLLSRLTYNEATFVEKGILETVSNDPRVQIRFLDSFVKAFRQTPFNRQNFLKQIWIASQTRFPDQAPVPTYFLNSTADRLVDYRCSSRIAQDWGSIVETHKQAGHDISLDDPMWVLKKIQTHL